MFNLQSFSSQKGSVADGLAANSLNRIRALLTKLLHNPETGVLWLRNDDEVVDIVKGQIVYIADTDSVALAQSGADVGIARSIAICLTDTVEPGEWGYFRCAGEAEVILENGLAPTEGDYIKSSITAGYGTVSATVQAVLYEPRIGIIIDASEYFTVNYPFVKIIIETCCQETLPPQ